MSKTFKILSIILLLSTSCHAVESDSDDETMRLQFQAIFNSEKDNGPAYQVLHATDARLRVIQPSASDSSLSNEVVAQPDKEEKTCCDHVRDSFERVVDAFAESLGGGREELKKD
jgi:hypothetical protein